MLGNLVFKLNAVTLIYKGESMFLVEYLDTRAIIALLALFMAIWSIVSTRKHNKLTVRPHLYEYIQGDAINYKCGFYIVNKGLGPAIIKSCKFQLDGEDASVFKLHDIVEKLPSQFGIDVGKLRAGTAISKDEIYTVIDIRWDYLKHDLPKDERIRIEIANDIKKFTGEIADRFGLIVEWESSYGEKGKLISLPSSDNVAKLPPPDSK
jgi:hypothetical protein